MYNMNDILTLLQNGQSADDIAKSFTTALNEALAEHKKADKVRKEKLDWMGDIVENILEYAEYFYPEYAEAIAAVEYSDDELIELVNAIDQMIPQLLGLVKLMSTPVPTPTPKVKTAPTSTFDQVMEQFFKKNGL